MMKNILIEYVAIPANQFECIEKNEINKASDVDIDDMNLSSILDLAFAEVEQKQFDDHHNDEKQAPSLDTLIPSIRPQIITRKPSYYIQCNQKEDQQYNIDGLFAWETI